MESTNSFAREAQSPLINLCTEGSSENKESEARNLLSREFLGDRLLSAAMPLNMQKHESAGLQTTASSAGSELPGLILLKQQQDAVSKERQVEAVAAELAKFISSAKKSLDLSVYSFNIRDPEAQKSIVDALNERARNGVEIRLAYFQGEKRIGEDQSSSEFNSSAEPDDVFEAFEMDPDFLSKLDPRISLLDTAQGAVKLPDDLNKGIDKREIRGNGQLMHNKYLIRDAGTQDAAVWTGSTNFTDDAFGNQDNNIIQLKSKEIAGAYTNNFNEMWESGKLAGTGKDGNRTAKVGASSVTVAFSPGDGAFIEERIAAEISAAKDSIHIASMAISNYQVLKALNKELNEGTKINGIYDKAQMDNVVRAWERSGSESSKEKLELWNEIKEHLVAKQTTSPLRGMMHNKTIQIDDHTVLTGSFNLSSNAARNAENIVLIQNTDIAKKYGNYINDLIITYGGMVK